MKNKTTYEMEDVMNLITKDLAEKGLAPDSASMEIWACVDGARISTKEIEIEVNVSWVGIPAQDDSEPPALRPRQRRVSAPDVDDEPPPQDLLDEAPRPGVTPALEIGINDITAAGAKIARAGGTGPFTPERVKRRLTDGESTEWPGSSPSRGR